ncbi:MAG: glutamine synthetase [Alphaproteobacteria bacterium]|nr:glutamine synthetase [Alphaproteobacteria bacterium]
MADAQPGDHDIVFVGHVDLGGVFRGKGVVGREWPHRCRWGVGWPPANLMLTPFGVLAPNAFGSRGDMFVVPDPATLVAVPAIGDAPPLRLALGHLRSADGAAWECCPRAYLEGVLADLEAEAGLRLKGAFEHEFLFSGLEAQPGDAFSLGAFRRFSAFAADLVRALDGAGITAETVIAEYAPQQIEVPVAPVTGLAIADQAAVFREVVRWVANGYGCVASFTPIAEAGGVGSGAHLHFSLLDRQGGPAAYDAASPTGLSAVAASFLAGVRRRLPDIVAVTAPTVVSYERLQPHRWSAAYNTMAVRDREAALRICPVRPGTDRPEAEQFNMEFRATDGSANPHLVLGIMAAAGLEGIRDRLPPDLPFEGDPEDFHPDALERLGIERLPTSLEDALARFDQWGRALVPPGLADAFVAMKSAEIASLEGADDGEVVARYRAVF